MNLLPIKLEKLRKHYNYSQSYLADVLGVSVIEYMGYENGRSMINYYQAKKIASLYHIGVEEIFKNDSEVTLYDVDNSKTDEINIAYFLPKQTLFSRLKQHPFILGAAIGLVVAIGAVTLIFTNVSKKPYVTYLDNTDRLSVSKTSVIYIDNYGIVKASGDNANGQISNLPSEKALKVQMGEEFSVVLLDDGTVEAIGAIEAYQKEIAKWKNIVDIASGNNHIIACDNKGKVYAVGDNTYNQCDIYEYSNIKNVYATSNGSILLDEDGNVYYAGSFIGTSVLKKFTNIKDVASSDNNLIILKEDGTCEYVASFDNSVYFDVNKWSDVIDVECGDQYFACLSADGKVKVASLNSALEADWENMIAIAGADDYLIGFDGENIYGVGKNTYNQFVNKENSNSLTLAQVKNINVLVDEGVVKVSFDEVSNASAYEVTLYINENTKETKKVLKNEVVSFVSDELEDNTTYIVGVKAIGDGTYVDSQDNEMVFMYTASSDEEENEEKVTINPYIVNSSKEDFENYLNDLGVTNIEAYEDENVMCEGDEATVVEILGGITPGSTYTRSELSARNISYSYCKIDVEKLKDGTTDLES